MAERALQTRDKILASAAHVFCERGYVGAGMAEIVLGTGMTRGAVYFHFSSKADLAKAIVTQHHDSWARGQHVEEPGLQGLDAMRVRIDAIILRLRQDVGARAAVRLAREADQIDAEFVSPFDDWADYFGYRLRQAQLLGQVRSDLDPTAYSRVLVGMLLGVIDHCGLDDDPSVPRPDVGVHASGVTAMWDLVQRGLSSTGPTPHR